MVDKITIDEVLEFIKSKGYIYSQEIRKELDNLRPISDNEIDKCIEENDDVFRKLASK
ncbi:hypothetical protein [Clostridioides difficile]|uniref:hypothetical protein n=1 Tax=Clostridioides difficile TaxID=1496 RepID=UPI00038CCCDF|nr:hypothetical protein [Clostridioides difficile]EJA6785232.1 hypothetical protein [Clostridioides difficile]EQH27370.1 hypothetical protein QM1_0978 [Clostridioides difficile DA00212]MDY6690641.1 hypothetical protein [Clostridioides difficile]